MFFYLQINSTLQKQKNRRSDPKKCRSINLTQFCLTTLIISHNQKMSQHRSKRLIETFMLELFLVRKSLLGGKRKMIYSTAGEIHFLKSGELKYTAGHRLQCQSNGGRQGSRCEILLLVGSYSCSFLFRRGTGGAHRPGDLRGDPPLVPCHLDGTWQPRRQVSRHLRDGGWRTHSGGETKLLTFPVTPSIALC